MKKGRFIILIMCMVLMNSAMQFSVSAQETKSGNQLMAAVGQTANSDTKAFALFVSGGEDHTHQYIVSSALAILNNDKGSSVLNDTSVRNVLMSYTDWPDVFGNETDYGTFAGHFYDPDTGKNWLGMTSPTAKSRAVSYFNQAVSLYNSGDYDNAYISLGKGSHYVSDLNEPHHASNLTALNSNHTEFEEYVDDNRLSFGIVNNTLDASVYTTAETTSLADILQAGAVYAKALASEAQDSDTYYTAGELCVQHAIMNVAQYFYKFAFTVGIYE